MRSLVILHRFLAHEPVRPILEQAIQEAVAFRSVERFHQHGGVETITSKTVGSFLILGSQGTGRENRYRVKSLRV